MRPNQPYDREKYIELALDVAETILGIFGFTKHTLPLKRLSKKPSKKMSLKRHYKSTFEIDSLLKYIE